jgi:hypothetical protein
MKFTARALQLFNAELRSSCPDESPAIHVRYRACGCINRRSVADGSRSLSREEIVRKSRKMNLNLISRDSRNCFWGCYNQGAHQPSSPHAHRSLDRRAKSGTMQDNMGEAECLAPARRKAAPGKRRRGEDVAAFVFLTLPESTFRELLVPSAPAPRH